MKIDATNADNLSDKVESEQKTRKKFLKQAKQLGCEIELNNIFKQTDFLLSKCTNQKEADDIKKLGIIAVYKLLGGGGELYLKFPNKDFTLVCKDD